MSRVALVGYTNAGKSTLMRALTGSEVYVADKLFATLDTTVRPLLPEARPRVLVSDTVGFINKLPHGLVASFKSTLDEALEAGLLAHVVDASDADLRAPAGGDHRGAGRHRRRRRAAPPGVQQDRSRAATPRPRRGRRQALLARWPDAVVMSARRPADVARLRERLIAFFNRDLVEGEVRVPYDRQQLRGDIFAACEVLGERYDEGGVIFRVRAHPAMLERLQAGLQAA